MSDLQDDRDAEHGYRTVGGKALRLARWAEGKEQLAHARAYTAKDPALQGAVYAALRMVEAQLREGV